MKIFKLLRLLWIIPILIIVFFISYPIVNNITASCVAKEIWKAPLPEQTTEIEKTSLAGKLVGNGNGMQFFGAILIKSNCSLEELEAHYSKINTNYSVEKQTTSKIDIIYNLSFKYEVSNEKDDFFIVYSWGDGIFPFCEFDLRGH